ncbi:carboxylesterase/lipase family protein [Streptomyces sp. RPT161]|uniref:carboxylesterase/lipase family protein n=1 Tax=Streptomyces sp. RPT161 TaxID=3015993 RepID=UPI0022B8CB2C|nr:carboxylesterase family protein [Streptomyces sp. RPT161]
MTSNVEVRGNTPVVTVPTGRLRGVVDGAHGAVAAFRGIPYAASPVGALRFAAPRPYPAWDGERDATVAGPSAPQGPSRLEAVMGARIPHWDEDGCLNLNVWTPVSALAGRVRPRPVLVWFHGGAYTSGAGGWDWYDGARLAALGDMVVVTANYRLGALGWLYLPEEGIDNLGARDQAAALRWVHETIGAFGGDPARITVGGQSAGANSAVALATDPATAAMVQRVLAQSGAFRIAGQDPGEAAEAARGLLRVLELPSPGSLGLLERLRAVPAKELLDAYAELAVQTARPGSIAPPMAPVLGGAGYPRPLLDAVRDGALDGRPLLIGTTTEEMTAFKVRGPELAAATARMFGADSDAIARYCAARGGDAYVYRFGRRPDPDPEGLGATHCADLPFLFGTFDTFPDAPMLGAVDAADRALSRSFAAAVTAFVTGGTPWPVFEADRRYVHDFDRSSAG